MQWCSCLRWLLSLALLLVAACRDAHAGATPANNAGLRNDGDLHTFVTRPDIRSPKFINTVNNVDKVTPGYLFLAPYDCLECESPSSLYISQQIGPHIYDGHGELVWSGASVARNRRVFDFKVTTIGGVAHLTFVAPNSTSRSVFGHSVGYIIDATLQLKEQVHHPDDKQDFHEFTTLHDGYSAIITLRQERQSSSPRTTFLDRGFQEVRIRDNHVLFEWWASEHLSLEENISPSVEQGIWDPFHVNAIEKTDNGEYLVSARATDTIYLLSAEDGRVIWRLGGTNSDFRLDGFTFSRQHDARLRSRNDTTIQLSFLDNAYDGIGSTPTAEQSSLLTVALHLTTSPMTATLVRRIPRPDGLYTFARGNMQVLDNGNVLANWGDNAYITEHTAGGELVFEGSFISSRLLNYRAYKFNFTSYPTDWPVAKAMVSINAQQKPITIIYVSWDGATQVHSWKAYAVKSDNDPGIVIGETRKTGFETSLVCQGYHSRISVEALDMNGERLSESPIIITELPLGWDIGSTDGIFPRLGIDRRFISTFLAGMVVMFLLLRVRTKRSRRVLPRS